MSIPTSTTKNQLNVFNWTLKFLTLFLSLNRPFNFLRIHIQLNRKSIKKCLNIHRTKRICFSVGLCACSIYRIWIIKKPCFLRFYLQFLFHASFIQLTSRKKTTWKYRKLQRTSEKARLKWFLNKFYSMTTKSFGNSMETNSKDNKTFFQQKAIKWKICHLKVFLLFWFVCMSKEINAFYL